MKTKQKKMIKKLLAGVMAAAMLVAGLPVLQVSAQTVSPAKPIVIVLDPGHGGYDGGAMHKWNGKTYREKDVNLAIAKACKKKLETYMGVKVYMTRSSDYFVSLTGRVAYAKKNGADLFVALHNNASTRTNVKGACVYYPNAHYNAKIGAKGKAVAQSIQNRLVALGLKNNGVLIRNSESKTKYPDKSLADYYNVIKNSKTSGFAGLIVEHAYISNASDCTKFLGTNDMLTKLGEADALGIASYYGLIPKTTVGLSSADATENGEVALQWNQAAGVDGYCIYRMDENQSTYQLIKKIKGEQILTYVDNTIVRGVSYEYAVCGYHTAKNATTYTALSNEIDAIYELPIPQALKAEQSANGKWKLTWSNSDMDGVSGYRIERKSAGAEEYEEIASIAGAETASYELNEKDIEDGAVYAICSYHEDNKYDDEGEYSEAVFLK